MQTMRKGTDIPFDIKNFPEGARIDRIDFAQNDNLVITKLADDFTYYEGVAYSTLTQEETLKIEPDRMIDIQLSFHINGHAKRTNIVRAKPGNILYKGVI